MAKKDEAAQAAKADAMKRFRDSNKEVQTLMEMVGEKVKERQVIAKELRTTHKVSGIRLKDASGQLQDYTIGVSNMSEIGKARSAGQPIPEKVYDLCDVRERRFEDAPEDD